MYLKQLYIDKNYIEAQDKVNYQGFFVDGNYDMLTQTQGEILRKKTTKLFGDGKALESHSDKFNDEELFYMNRIAFYLFRFKGENVTFPNFTMRLKILQTGNYQKRLAFWLNIIDEEGTEIIPKDNFLKVLRLAYMQDLGFKLNV